MVFHLLRPQTRKMNVFMDREFDDSYLEALQQQDPKVEEHLILCFSKRLKAPLRRRCYGTQVVEDVMQETLFRVLTYFRSGKTLRTASHLPAFVRSVSSNVSREWCRLEQRSEALEEDYDGPADERANPETAAMAREAARTVQRTLLRMSEKDQHILRLVFLEESDKDQVCRDLHTNREHLRVLLYRAIHRFRALTERSKAQSSTPLREPAENLTISRKTT